MIKTHGIPRIGKTKQKKLTSRDRQKLNEDLMERSWQTWTEQYHSPKRPLMLHNAFKQVVNIHSKLRSYFSCILIEYPKLLLKSGWGKNWGNSSLGK